MALNANFRTRVVQADGFWMLQVGTPEGLWLEYHLASLPQARYFAAVFGLGPPSFPAPHLTYFQEPREKWRPKVAA